MRSERKKVKLFTFFRAARKKSPQSGVKTESGKRKTFNLVSSE